LHKHPEFKAYAALAAVCFFWGTTYLGIRIALESLPPFALVSLRYLLSGSILVVAAVATRTSLPHRKELARTAMNGVIMLGFGNGCLAFAEQWVPSGLAALILTISPFWMVGLEALVPGGEPLHGPTIAGMLIGLAGVAFLLTPGGWGDSHGAVVAGFVTLQVGCAGWAFGSILQRRTRTTAHPVFSGAIQQLATGIVFLLPWLLVKSHPVQWSARGISALAYLVIFGSIVGYSAYIYALSTLPVAVVSIYTYVNPIVAVLLGWLFFREPFGIHEALGMAIIFVGVAVVKRYGRKPSLPAQQFGAKSAAEGR
jgi:drug/metabolite transporter (DMT)-like permease